MENKEIEVLKKQIEKLHAEKFDLEAWKSATVILLDRIFGPKNKKITEIEKIRYEQSSWSLRDASGSKNLLDSCKKQGEEILNSAILELENFGLPEEVINARKEPFRSVIVSALEEELKIAQYKQIRQLIQSDMTPEDKKKALLEKLNDYDADVVPNILMRILCDDLTAEVI